MEAAYNSPRLQGAINIQYSDSIDKEEEQEQRQQCEGEFLKYFCPGQSIQYRENSNNDNSVQQCCNGGSGCSGLRANIEYSLEALVQYVYRSFGGSRHRSEQEEFHQKTKEEAANQKHLQEYFLFTILQHSSLKPSSLACLVKYFGWIHIRSV